MSAEPAARIAVGDAVDWDFAATVGARLARPAPPISDYTRSQVIEQLTSAARAAEPPVREVTRLGTDHPVPEARIVDRPQWIRAATESMRAMTNAEQASRRGLVGALAGRLTGVQSGAVLAFVSAGILGQYDPFGVDGGQLLLVYPNVIAVERQLRVQPDDFRLWVCLHEVTHRVQFTAHPWLAGYMIDSLAVLTQDGTEDLKVVIGRLAEFARDRKDGMVGFMRAIQTEAQRAALDRLLVLATLLEGHADHVMDAVGPAVVPSVATIRSRFDDRRNRKQSPLQRLLRALIGVDAKLAQYTRGKAFVDHVVGRVGMDRFNVIWTGAETLPRPAEIDDPQRWIDRVL